MFNPISAPAPITAITSHQIKSLQQNPLAESIQSALVNHFLTVALPQQQDATRLLSTLWLADQAGTLPTQAKQSIAQLLDTLATPEQISSANGLKQSLLNSGLFLESQTLQGTATQAADFKANLMRISQALLGTLPEDLIINNREENARAGQVNALSRHSQVSAITNMSPDTLLAQLFQDVEGSLARLQTHQLMHIQQQTSQCSHWLIEVPLRSHDGIDVLQVHIERDNHASNSNKVRAVQQTVWQMTLSFDFPTTGAVTAKLRWQQPTLAITFHAQRSDTYAMLNEETRSLQAVLVNQGLTEVNIQSHCGLPHADTLPQPLRSQVQIKA